MKRRSRRKDAKMPMDLEALGSGAATGFVVTVLTLLGWGRRINRLECDKLDKDLFLANQLKFETEIKSLRDEFARSREDIAYIRERVDKLVNGK